MVECLRQGRCGARTSVECPSEQGSSGARTSVVCTTEQGQVSEQLRAESATGGVLWKKMLLEISQNSQENTSAKGYLHYKTIFCNIVAFMCN